MTAQINNQAKYLKDYQIPDYRIDHVNLHIELADNHTIIQTELTIIREGEHNRALKLDGQDITLINLLIDEVALNSNAYTVTTEQLIIHQVPQQFKLTLHNHIDPANNTALEGLYKSGDAFCTQCEAEGFRRITYFLDRPDVLATYTTTIVADRKKYPSLLANGNKVAQGELDNDQHWVTWKDPFKKPCYLFALVAGKFDCLSDNFTTRSGRKVLLELYVELGNLDRSHHAMASLKAAMAWDEKTYDLEYDLDIYMIVAVDFFNMGAMENKGLNIFNTKFVLANEKTATDQDYSNIEAVIGHEYFHNWTGNRVTCRDWFQLSLKEGLTVFREQQFSASMGSAAIYRINEAKLMRSKQFAEDAGPMAHPIRPEKVIEMNNFYTVTVYDKGAEVIRMLHTLIGEDNFKQGMKLYFERFDGQAVTCDDFVQAMFDSYDQDISQFSRWYNQVGTPTITATTNYNKEQQSLTIELVQSHVQLTQSDLLIPIGVEIIVDNQSDESLPSHLVLSETKQAFEFTGITTKPVVAFGRNFSAPVIINYAQSQTEYLSTLQYSKDSFSRWDAMQSIYLAIIKNCITEQSVEKVIDDELIHILQKLISQPGKDLELTALLLKLPAVEELSAHFRPIPVLTLNQTLIKIQTHFSTHCKTELEQQYRYLLTQPESTAVRALKNRCLEWLAYLQTKSVEELIIKQYEYANNMTDKLASLQVAKSANLACFEELMQIFEKEWTHDPLVMDKWFSLWGSWPNTQVFTKLQELRQHSVFNIGNPNRVMALFHSFANANSYFFHQADGQGYRLIKDILIELNELNPMTAARLITPLLSFKHYEKTHAELMHSVLTELFALPNLSKDLFEKIDRSLNTP